MKKWVIRTLIFGAIVWVFWTGLTLWVGKEGPPKLNRFTSTNDSLSVLIVYDPDPIYNLDEQLGKSIGMGLSSRDVAATVATVRACDTMKLQSFAAVILIANTYNWYPDAGIISFVEGNAELKLKPVVAITIGSGSTEASAKRFKELLTANGITIFNEHQWWLMRPNDEDRLKEKNVDVAKDQAFVFGQDIAGQLSSIANSK